MGSRIFLQLLAGLSLMAASQVLVQGAGVPSTIDKATLAFAIIVHLIVDVATLRLGVGLYSTVFIVLPVISLGFFAPEGLVQPLFNSQTGLVDRYWPIMLSSLSYFWAAWTLLLVVFRLTADRFDQHFLRLIRTSRTRLDGRTTSALSLLSIAAAIIYRPGIPGGAYRSVEFNLLPGNAWNTIAVVALFLVLLGQRSMLRSVAITFVPAWLLLHFARVDLMGYIAFAALIWMRSTGQDRVPGWRLRRQVPAIVLGVVAVGTFAYIGFVRGQGLQADASVLVRGIRALVNYPTVQDVIYSTAAAIFVKDHYGSIGTLATLGHQLLPSFAGGVSVDAARTVSSIIHTNNGMLLPGEFYLNFGTAGLYVAPIVTLAILGLAAKVGTTLALGLGRSMHRIAAVAVYAAAWLTASRTMWYGLIYYLNAAMLVAPLLVLLCWLAGAQSYTETGPPHARITTSTGEDRIVSDDGVR